MPLDPRRRAILADMGIADWQARDPAALAGGAAVSEPLDEDTDAAVDAGAQAAPVSTAASAFEPPQAEPVAAPPQPEAAPPVTTPAPKPEPQPVASEPTMADEPPPPEPETYMPMDQGMPSFDDIPVPDEVPGYLLEAEQDDGWERDNGVSRLDWDGLAARVADCKACGLCQSRTQTVFARGDRAADWMVVGEAPGADEDAQGQPFVGRAGKLLDQVLFAAGLPRDAAFIGNVLKCRPPGNRDPQPEEVSQCLPYLERQIALVQPKIILCVGRHAAQNLLATDKPVGRLRGRVHHYGDNKIPVVVTYHPSYLLRQPREKRKVWEDLKLAMTTLANHG